MRLFVEVVKRWLVPGSMPFLLLGTVAAAVLLNASASLAVLGRIWLTLLALVYLLLSLPAVAAALLARLARGHRQLSGEECRQAGAAAVVVFGNGSVHYTNGVHAIDYLTRRSVFAAFEGVRIYQLTRPDLVIVTGGADRQHPGARSEAELLRRLLLDCGVPDEAIVVEPASRTTVEQVANVARVLARLGRERSLAIAVTTPAHAPRVSACARRTGLQVVTSVPRELTYDEGAAGWRLWLPSMTALTGSSSAIYEYMAATQAIFRRSQL